ncbi:hypothetical protein BV898_15056 [Hypsibius exemplaris]|uniref:Uncharacterized protein n=1 Tax=Hypsibius exemplaris TaxID=2072580 RepID=A0A9X6NJH9_HYPEX|nr:hypothetical protein BV898_15056 [Hypsibius exemplaris]
MAAMNAVPSRSPSQRRSRSSNSRVQQQEEPLRVKNFVGAALPSEEYLRWFQSKVKYDQLLRFHALLTARVAQLTPKVGKTDWVKICAEVKEGFDKLPEGHPLLIMLEKSGDNLRQLYDELKVSAAKEADALLAHRTFNKATFMKRLAIACDLRSRKWQMLEETDGGRIELNKFRLAFKEAETRAMQKSSENCGQPSVDLDAMVAECTQYLVKYIQDNKHISYPDVAKAYVKDLRAAYRKFHYDFPLGEDMVTILTAPVPTPPAAPESPLDDQEAQDEPLFESGDFHSSDVEMTPSKPEPTANGEGEAVDSSESAADALAEEPMMVDEMSSTVAEKEQMVVEKEPTTDTSTAVQEREKFVPMNNSPSMRLIPTVSEEVRPVPGPSNDVTSILLPDAVPEEIPLAEKSNQGEPFTLSPPPESSQVQEGSKRPYQVAAEPLPEMDAEPVASQMKAVKSTLGKTTKTTLKMPTSPAILGPATLSKNGAGKKKPTVHVPLQVHKKQKTDLSLDVAVTSSAEVNPPAKVPSVELATEPIAEKLESIPEVKTVEHMDVSVQSPNMDLAEELLASRKLAGYGLLTYLRAFTAYANQVQPAELLDYEPLKLPVKSSDFSKNVINSESVVGLTDKLSRAQCNVTDASPKYPLLGLNFLACKANAPEMAKKSLAINLICRPLLKKDVEGDSSLSDASVLAAKRNRLLGQIQSTRKLRSQTQSPDPGELNVRGDSLKFPKPRASMKTPGKPLKQPAQPSDPTTPPANLRSRPSRTLTQPPSTLVKSTSKK